MHDECVEYGGFCRMCGGCLSNGERKALQTFKKIYRDLTPTFRVRRVFIRICKPFMTSEEVGELGMRLCKKYSLTPSHVFKSAFSDMHVGWKHVSGLIKIDGNVISVRNQMKSLQDNAPYLVYHTLKGLLNKTTKLITKGDLSMKTTGELRKALAKCFEEARKGKLSGDAMRGVIGCANQINLSISNEIKARAQLTREGSTAESFGSLSLDSNDK